MTAVDRATRCIVGVAVVWERTTQALQTLLDTSVWAANYFSDAFHLYLSGVYRRQLYKCAHPRYPAHVRDFVSV